MTDKRTKALYIKVTEAEHTQIITMTKKYGYTTVGDYLNKLEDIIMIPNQKYINEWLNERNITLAPSFAEQLRNYAELYKKGIISP